MKWHFITGFIALAGLSVACERPPLENESNALRCDCSGYGITDSWADSNNISCYTIPVPRNIAIPDSGQFALAVVIAKALQPTSQPPLLYLHGGPGIATIENVKRYLQNPTWKFLREQRDLIFFDYRGTGFSEPELCMYLQDSIAAFRNTNPSEEKAKAKEISLYKDCREKLSANGIHLTDFTSLQLAADAEEVRSAFNITAINIYGVSYGTTIALNLLRHFPANIKSVILDSPFPPNAPWYDFVRPFDTCFTTLEKYILDDPLRAIQFASIREDFVKAVSRLNNMPVQISLTENGDTINKSYNGDDFAWSIWSAMLNPKSIPYVPLAIREIAHGNDSILQPWSTAFSSPDAYGKFSETQSHAIMCFEARPRKEMDQEEYLKTKYPDFTSFNSGYDTKLCEVWRPEIAENEIYDPVVSDIPVLILTGEFDPVCPPLFGTITSRSLVNSTTLLVPSASHAAIHADVCLRNVANEFLTNPKKKQDTKCVYDRKKIEFVTKDLITALKNL